MTWWIGCSGFHYKDWKGLFYPQKMPQREWFSYYCEHFNSLELNVTFYRFPKLEFLTNWYNKSPRTFRFSAKVPRLITHYKKFVDCQREIDDFYEILGNGLKDKLGCVLFQMHPRMVYTPEKLEQIVNCLNNDFLNVLEFRHESWWNEDVFSTFRKQRVTFCSISYPSPSLPDDVIATSPAIYYRFHGVPDLYRSLYSEEFLKKISDQIHHTKKVKEVYAYFNNDFGGMSITNAKQLQEMSEAFTAASRR